MIKIINNTIDRTLAYLEENYPQDKEVNIHLLEESDCVQDPDGNVGFGVFCEMTQDIYIAIDIPDPEVNVPANIAHEYMHFLQWCEGRPYDEEEADRFAEEVLEALDIGQETPKQCCGTCEWHEREHITQGFVCVNGESEHVADWTDNDQQCDKWEAKKEE